VHRDLGFGHIAILAVLSDPRRDTVDSRPWQCDREHAVLHCVGYKDRPKALTDIDSDAPRRKRERHACCARATGAVVATDDHDRGTAIGFLVEDEIRIFAAVGFVAHVGKCRLGWTRDPFHLQTLGDGRSRHVRADVVVHVRRRQPRVLREPRWSSRRSGLSALFYLHWCTLVLQILTDVRDLAFDGRRGHRGGAGQARPRIFALPTAEVAVGIRNPTAPRRDEVAVRAVALRATGLSPLETRLLEDAVEPFGFGLTLDGVRAGYNPRRLHVRGDLPSFDNL